MDLINFQHSCKTSQWKSRGCLLSVKNRHFIQFLAKDINGMQCIECAALNHKYTVLVTYKNPSHISKRSQQTFCKNDNYHCCCCIHRLKLNVCVVVGSAGWGLLFLIHMSICLPGQFFSTYIIYWILIDHIFNVCVVVGSAGWGILFLVHMSPRTICPLLPIPTIDSGDPLLLHQATYSLCLNCPMTIIFPFWYLFNCNKKEVSYPSSHLTGPTSGRPLKSGKLTYCQGEKRYCQGKGKKRSD